MIVANDESLQLHFCVTERAMNMAEHFRKLPMEDVDMRVVQVLSMRAGLHLRQLCNRAL